MERESNSHGASLRPTVFKTAAGANRLAHPRPRPDRVEARGGQLEMMRATRFVSPQAGQNTRSLRAMPWSRPTCPQYRP